MTKVFRFGFVLSFVLLVLYLYFFLFMPNGADFMQGGSLSYFFLHLYLLCFRSLMQIEVGSVDVVDSRAEEIIGKSSLKIMLMEEQKYILV